MMHLNGIKAAYINTDRLTPSQAPGGAGRGEKGYSDPGEHLQGYTIDDSLQRGNTPMPGARGGP